MIDHDSIFIATCVARFNDMWAANRWDRLFNEATARRVEARIRDDLQLLQADQNLSLIDFDVDVDENATEAGGTGDACIDIVYNIRSLDGDVYNVVADERSKSKAEYEIMRHDDVNDPACTVEGKPKPRTMKQVIRRIDPV